MRVFHSMVICEKPPSKTPRKLSKGSHYFPEKKIKTINILLKIHKPNTK